MAKNFRIIYATFLAPERKSEISHDFRALAFFFYFINIL